MRAVLLDLDAASVDVLLAREQLEELAIAAADIEHARARLDHAGDQALVGPDRVRGARVALRGHQRINPRRRAAPFRKPRSVSNMTGSFSRNASWPLSLLTSTKLTFAATALRARTISRLSPVG